MKHEENGLISSAAVVSAESENPDDGEFREQEIFSQCLLFCFALFIPTAIWKSSWDPFGTVGRVSYRRR